MTAVKDQLGGGKGWGRKVGRVKKFSQWMVTNYHRDMNLGRRLPNSWKGGEIPSDGGRCDRLADGLDMTGEAARNSRTFQGPGVWRSPWCVALPWVEEVTSWTLMGQEATESGMQCIRKGNLLHWRCLSSPCPISGSIDDVSQLQPKLVVAAGSFPAWLWRAFQACISHGASGASQKKRTTRVYLQRH